MLSADVNSIREKENIICLCISIILVPTFIFWVSEQEKHGRPALIPNSLWKDKSFTSITIMLLLTFAVLQSMELVCSLL